MGIFGKKESGWFSDAHEMLGDARLDPKEMKKFKKKMDGKVSRTGDLKAGLSDLKNGRKGKIPPPPPPRKGRSMWS